MTNREKLFEAKYFEKLSNITLAEMLSSNVCSNCVANDYCKENEECLSCQQTLEKWLQEKN